MFTALIVRRGFSRAACIVVAALSWACILAMPSAARAQRSDAAAPRLLLPRSGMVRAGERIDLRWAGDVRDVDELEIMLTIDGPQRRTLQISPELDPVRGVFVWRVPEMGRGYGRFRVRYHLDGHEVEGTPSARFELLTSIASTMEPALLPESGATGFPLPGAAGSSGGRAGEGESEDTSGRSFRARQARLATTIPAAGPVSIAIAAARSRPRGGPESFPARN